MRARGSLALIVLLVCGGLIAAPSVAFADDVPGDPSQLPILPSDPLTPSEPQEPTGTFDIPTPPPQYAQPAGPVIQLGGGSLPPGFVAHPPTGVPSAGTGRVPTGAVSSAGTAEASAPVVEAVIPRTLTPVAPTRPYFDLVPVPRIHLHGRILFVRR